MAIFRLRKIFSLVTEKVRREYLTKPGDYENLPKVVQNYYNQGVNKDFYDFNLQGCHQFNPFPVPMLNKEPDKDGYIPLFAENQDLCDLGHPTVYHKDGMLFKKTGIFFRKMSSMNDLEFKSFLLKAMMMESDNLGQEWESSPNGKRIIALEEKIESKINKL